MGRAINADGYYHQQRRESLIESVCMYCHIMMAGRTPELLHIAEKAHECPKKRAAREQWRKADLRRAA